MLKFHKYIILVILTTERHRRYFGFMTRGLTVFSFNSFHPPMLLNREKRIRLIVYITFLTRACLMNVNKPALALTQFQVSYQYNYLFSCLRNYRSLSGTQLVALICCVESEEIRGTHLSTIFLLAITSIIITSMWKSLIIKCFIYSAIYSCSITTYPEATIRE